MSSEKRYTSKCYSPSLLSAMEAIYGCRLSDAGERMPPPSRSPRGGGKPWLHHLSRDATLLTVGHDACFVEVVSQASSATRPPASGQEE